MEKRRFQAVAFESQARKKARSAGKKTERLRGVDAKPQ